MAASPNNLGALAALSLAELALMSSGEEHKLVWNLTLALPFVLGPIERAKASKQSLIPSLCGGQRMDIMRQYLAKLKQHGSNSKLRNWFLGKLQCFVAVARKPATLAVTTTEDKSNASPMSFEAAMLAQCVLLSRGAVSEPGNTEVADDHPFLSSAADKDGVFGGSRKGFP